MQDTCQCERISIYLSVLLNLLVTEKVTGFLSKQAQS
jgi:hypothetical protein